MGAGPELPDEVGWWQTDDSWQSRLFAAVVDIRAAADEQVCRCARHAGGWPVVCAPEAALRAGIRASTRKTGDSAVLRMYLGATLVLRRCKG